jgi:anti-anti-sigma factor
MLRSTVVTVTDDMDDHCQLTARVTADGHAARIELAGELTGGTRQALIESLRGQLADGCTDVRIDMREIKFLDARGLAASIVAAQMAAEARAALAFDNPSPFINRILGLGGLDGLCCYSEADGAIPFQRPARPRSWAAWPPQETALRARG